MQENPTTQHWRKRKGVASLFDDYELKDILRKYIHFLVAIEIGIFLICWLYQLGIDEVAVTGKAVDIPFPWKVYFMVSFLAPLTLTFLAGIIISGFNSFLYGHRGVPIFKEDHADGSPAKVARIVNFCFQLPFLLTLFLLGMLLGVIYNLGEIFSYLARFGEAAAKWGIIGLTCVLVAGTVVGVVRMVLNYKLRRKDMEYAYKREVMDRLGVAILDEHTLIDNQGRLVDTQHLHLETINPKSLPPSPSDDEQTDDGQPDSRPES